MRAAVSCVAPPGAPPSLRVTSSMRPISQPWSRAICRAGCLCLTLPVCCAGMAACSFGRWLLLSRSNGQLGLWGGEGLFPPLLTVLEKASSGPGPDVAGPPRTGSMQSAPVQDQHFGGTEGITTRGGGIRCLVALLPEGMTPPGRGWCCPQGPASGWQNQQNAPLEASSGLVSSRRLG